jgi:hypothetical protein
MFLKHATRFALAVALLAGAAAFAGDKLNPSGKPKDFDAGDVQKYALWHDDDGWHLRTTTAKKIHHFKGVVVVKGGTFENVKSLVLEAKDRWSIGPEKHKVIFDFATDTHVDGFDWHTSKDADSIEFDLEIGPGNDKAPTQKKEDRVFVGEKGDHPDKIPFTLPAHPDAAKHPKGRK